MRSKSTIISLVFLTGVGLATFVLDRALSLLFAMWSVVNNPLLGDNFTLSTLAGLFLSIVGAVYAYKRKDSKLFVEQTISEVGKVSWPTASETKVNTVVGIVFSFISAGILGLFDGLFSWLTNNNLFLY